MGIKQLSKPVYRALLTEIETKQVQKNFVRRLLRAVNSGASELQSETLVQQVYGANLATDTGILLRLDYAYSMRHGGYIYMPIYKQSDIV